MSKFFRNLYQSKKNKARLGVITTDHGIINTPAFVPVGTKGTIKALLPTLTKEIGIQTAFVNTYHLVTHPGPDVIEKAGGIHRFSRLNIPLMSDSGGFQVFSLGRSKIPISLRQNVGATLGASKDQRSLLRQGFGEQAKSQFKNQKEKIGQILQDDNSQPTRPMIEKISDDGVKFRSVFDGELIEFTPEKSMEYQRQLGADMNMAFDECTYYPASYKYAKKAMKRTHQWLVRCIKYDLKSRHNVFRPPHPKGTQAIGSKHVSSISNKKQFLYGVIQGATFEDLRRQSAEFVVSQNTAGVAIGGVSVGERKKEMRDQVNWVADYLPEDRPVHLLGVGQIDDIIDLVRYGVDTFDCVEPTRLARMGILIRIKNLELRIQNFKFEGIDILKGQYRNNLEPVAEECHCYVCRSFTKSYLHHLFKQREILAYNLATYHNLWVMERLMETIRKLIGDDKL